MSRNVLLLCRFFNIIKLWFSKGGFNNTPKVKMSCKEKYFTVVVAFLLFINSPVSAGVSENAPPKVETGQSPSDAPVDIPALIDRPFEIDAGPFVSVREFKLTNAEDYPEHDVYLAEIMPLLDAARQRQPERGFSIGELQEVADEVTRYYRRKGLILSTAVIPVQTVENGIVEIDILIGRLGRIIVEGNKRYRASILERPFLDMIDKPIVQKHIEAALLGISDYPGLSVFGVFRPGLRVGEADLVLKVQQERLYDVALRVDNHGLRETGRRRVRAVVDWNNTIGFADRLTATYQRTYTPQNSDYWSLDYEFNLGKGFKLGLGTLRNEFELDNLSRPEITTENHAIYLDKSFIRSRAENLSVRLSMAQKRSTTEVPGVQFSESSERLAVLEFEVNYDSVDSFHPFKPLLGKFVPAGFGGGLNFFNLSYSRGFNNILGAMGSSEDQILNDPNQGNADNIVAEGQFNKVFASYRRLQLLTKNQSLLFQTEFQWASDILVALERYSAGGVNNVRGFPDAQALFDKALFFSLEYIVNPPFIADKPAFDNRTWGELLKFSFFYDFVRGRQNELVLDGDPSASGHWLTLRSVGTGLRFNLPGGIDARLMYAHVLGPDTANDNDSERIWADFTYTF